MQFGSNRKKRFVSNPLAELYDQPLQFYGQPPLENIALSEFETFAVERLKRKTAISLDSGLNMKHLLLIFSFSKFLCSVEDS